MPAAISMRRLSARLWREWIRPLALPLLCVAAAKSAIADINYVPSGSMEPTILPGDVVAVNKLAYDLKVPFTTTRLARWADPARGDVVVCFEPGDGTRLVKRVVGLPGDTLELRREILYVNGTPLIYSATGGDAGAALPEADRARGMLAREQLGRHSHAVMALRGVPALRSFGPLTVPAGAYFVMGDNRDNSKDSRFFGCVPRDQIVGEVAGVFVSGDLDRWLAPRFGRFFSGLE